MPKPKYRLQPVLEVRDKAKEDAARLLAARRQQLAAAEAELAARERAVAECRAKQTAAREKMLEEAEGGPVEVQALVTHRTHLADLRRSEEELLAEVERQRGVVAAAEAEVEKAVGALVEASKESRVIEVHREAWREGVRRDEERRSQKAGDEFATVTHGRRGQE